MRYAVDAGQSITSRRESKDSSTKKLEKEITKQAKRVLKRWVPIFGLSDWRIEVFTAQANTIGTSNGLCSMVAEVNHGSRTAKIGIDFEYHWNDEDGYSSFEATMLHELLHLIAVEQGVNMFKEYLDKRGRALYYEFEEEFIDRMAKILVAGEK